MPAKSNQKTIAVLADHISFMSEGYEGRLRRTFHASCRARGLNLLLYYGRALEEPHPASAAHNAIFDLVDPEYIQGVILVSSLLSGTCGAERMAAFAQRYRPFAACSVGVTVPGIPSVQIDNRPGMEAVVEHLIVAHGRRRIAFMEGYSGQPESQARFAAYRAVLARHELEFDPALVVEGEFIMHRGYGAMEELLARGVELDALVCANDAMATGAVAALAHRGRRVPHDLPVTGFDDLTYARLANPPLTTVAQPLEAMAELALNLVLDQAAGRPVPMRNVLDTKAIFRTSCGCVRKTAALRTPPPPAAPPKTASESLARRRPELRSELLQRFVTLRGDAPVTVDRILDALDRELRGQADCLLPVIDDVLETALIDTGGERHRALHEAMAFLRLELSDHEGPALNALWHEVDHRIVVAATVALFRQRIDLDYNYVQLVGAGERVSVSFELDSIGHALQQCLPATGVRSAFLSRFTDSAHTELQPFVRLVEGRLRVSRADVFPAKQLLPADAYALPSFTLAVFPMIAGSTCLGVAAFEYAESIIGYQMLRDQAGAALERVLLHREVVDKTLLHERSTQERQAATERMQALRVLAGGVAHDLNNALGPLVALPDIMLEQLSQLDGEPDVLRDLQADVQSIKAATLHAAQTIKDLLTLSRQGRTPKTAIDLNQAVSSCLGGGARFIPDANSGVRLMIDLCPRSLTVIASEAHLARALVNLVHNAVDAISGSGEVVVRTRAKRLQQPHFGYETIPIGDYALIEVSDTGVGLQTDSVGRLFEPFFSTKEVRDQSGTGLGLAIVHGVVKEHDGFIDVRSEPGKGSTFTLYFPLSQEAAFSQFPESARAHERARILMVDDDPAQLRTARRVLMHYGHEVDTLTGSQEAVELFNRIDAASDTPYALVILDMHLGDGADGLAVLHHIRARWPNQRAIMVSGHAPDDRIAMALEARIPWLAKPYTADALASIVRDTLSDRPSMPLRVSSKPPLEEE